MPYGAASGRSAGVGRAHTFTSITFLRLPNKPPVTGQPRQRSYFKTYVEPFFAKEIEGLCTDVFDSGLPTNRPHIRPCTRATFLVQFVQRRYADGCMPFGPSLVQGPCSSVQALDDKASGDNRRLEVGGWSEEYGYRVGGVADCRGLPPCPSIFFLLPNP